MDIPQRDHNQVLDHHGPRPSRLPERTLDTIQPNLQRLSTLLLPPTSSSTPDTSYRNVQTVTATRSEKEGERNACHFPSTRSSSTGSPQDGRHWNSNEQSSIILRTMPEQGSLLVNKP